MGPVVASCLPGLRVLAPPATVLRVLVADPAILPKLLGLLADHHLSPIDIRINRAPVDAHARVDSPAPGGAGAISGGTC